MISVTDGRVCIRATRQYDAKSTGSDRALDGCAVGEDGAASPAARIIAGNEIVGWIDYHADREWLEPREVRMRYHVRATSGYDDHALRAVQLLMHFLATRTAYQTAALELRPDDDHATAVATAAGFTFRRSHGPGAVFTRPIPPLAYTDGVVTIRRQRVDDIDKHLEAIDDQQIDWLWEPGDREKWEALSPAQQRARNLAHLSASHDSFGAGPTWRFSADTMDANYVAYVDCDLANNHVPAGEPNISYTGHPARRGQGNVSRAVRLLSQFLLDHTGARSAHIIVDEQNAASLRVARAIGATESQRWVNERGRTMIRHVLALR